MTPGFPHIGRTIPAIALAAASGVVGAIAAALLFGVSGWLIIGLVLAFGAAALPRAPIAAGLVVVLAIVLVASGHVGYEPRFIVLLAAGHLMLVLNGFTAWLPWRSRVQLRLLRPALLRYLAVQVGAQVVAFGVLTLGRIRDGAGTTGTTGPDAVVGASGGSIGEGLVWLGVVGAASAVLLAVVVLVPALLRPSRP